MHDVAVVLDLHQLVHTDRSVLADAAQVVAPEVDEHDVLGALLLVGQQLGGDAPVLLGRGPARAGAGDRLGRDVAPGDRQQRLGARTGDLEVAEVEEVHVGARVDGAQATVDRERLDRRGRRPALGGDDLEGVAGVDVADDPLDHRFEALAVHVRLELRHGRARSAGLLARHRPGERGADLADRRHGRIVCAHRGPAGARGRRWRRP